MNFYKRFIGDYQRDTGHLSMIQHGAYSLMLDNFYATARPLPADRKSLYRLVRADGKPECEAIDAIAKRFWKPMPKDRAALYELLKCDLQEKRQQLDQVATGDWYADGGLINVRALREMVNSFRIGETNRKTAIERENRKRELGAQDAAKKGGSK